MPQGVKRSNHDCLLDTRKMGVEDDRLIVGVPSAISNTDNIDHQELCWAPSFRIVSIVSRYYVMLSTSLFPQLQLWRSLA